MSYRTIKNLKQKVGDMLKENPATRNSDITLMIEIWKRHFPQRIKKGSTGEDGVWLKDLYDLPSEGVLGRVRRKIQESGKFLPTDERVARARKMNMDEWRVAMGYPTKNTAGTKTPSWTPPSEQEYREDCSMCHAQKQGVFVPPHIHKKIEQKPLFGFK